MPQPDISTIAEIVRVHAVKRPDAVALVIGDRTINFADWVAGPLAEDPCVTTGPDDVAFLMYTSVPPVRRRASC